MVLWVGVCQREWKQVATFKRFFSGFNFHMSTRSGTSETNLGRTDDHRTCDALWFTEGWWVGSLLIWGNSCPTLHSLNNFNFQFRAGITFTDETLSVFVVLTCCVLLWCNLELLASTLFNWTCDAALSTLDQRCANFSERGKVYSTELHRQYSSCLAPVTIGAQMRGLAMLHHQRWINVVAFFSEPLPMSPARQKEELRKSKCQPFSSCWDFQWSSVDAVFLDAFSDWTWLAFRTF